MSTYRAVTTSYPFSWRVVFFWFANVLLWVAVGKDTWVVIQAKREINAAIREISGKPGKHK
jgi:hypothetical protein